MSDHLYFEGKKFISSRRAAQLCGYTQDYVGQLIRGKKIEARMVGRLWFVAEESILTYQRSYGLPAPLSEAIQAPKPKLSEVLPKEPVPELQYAPDERPLMPALSKSGVAPVVEVAKASVIVKAPIVSPLPATLPSPARLSQFGQKVVAAVLSLSLVVSGYWMTNAENAKAAYSFVTRTGEVLGTLLADQIGQVAATINSTSSFVSHVAAVAQSDLSPLDAAALATYRAIHPLFVRSGGIFASLFDGGKSNGAEGGALGTTTIVIVADDSNLLAAQPEVDAGSDATSVAPSPVINNYYTQAGASAAELASLRAELESQISVNASRSYISNENARNSRDNAGNGRIYRSNIDDSNLSDATLSGSTTINGTVDVFGSISSGSISTGSLTAGDILFTNSTTTSLFSTNLFATNANFGNITSFTAPVAPYFTATSSAASVLPYASTTAFTASGFAYFATTGGNVGIGTTSPQATLSIQQTSNGEPIISAYRATDLAPSGDFISYMSKSGTPIFRVDNSGNLMAGGIINTGSQTITSVSGPQFRVQYDSSNEVTLSVSAAGATSIGLNGSAPSLTVTPQSDSVAAVNFTDASANSILSIDTENSRVGVGTATPLTTLDVAGTIRATSQVQPTSGVGAELTWDGSQSNLRSYNRSASTWQPLRIDGSTLVLNASSGGNIGIGTTTPWATFAVNPVAGTAANQFVVGSSSATSLLLTNAGTLLIGTTSAQGGSKLQAAGSILANGASNTYLTVNAPAGNESGVRITKGGSDTWYLYQPANSNDLRIYDNTASPGDRVTFQSGGNVGIGTTTPWAQLSVNPNGVSGPEFAIGSSTKTDFTVSNRGFVGIGLPNPGHALDIVSTDSVTFRSLGSGNWHGLHFEFPDASAQKIYSDYGSSGEPQLVLGTYTNRANQLVLDTTGNVGIGTTTPSQVLTIDGSSSVVTGGSTPVAVRVAHNNQDGGANTYSLTSPYVSYQLFTDDGSGTGAGVRGEIGLTAESTANSSSALTFGVHGTEKMRINSSGNVGIGTTTPGAKLDISETDSGGSPGVKTLLSLTASNNQAFAPQNSGPRILLNSAYNSGSTVYSSAAIYQQAQDTS
ncbi:MAG TPA: hypothetical protein VIR98_00055, partial [Candidatus Paceibacterota bacterium]